MTRHGFPAANTLSGMSRVTTLPAPMTARDPMRTPARIKAPPPPHTPDPIAPGAEQLAQDAPSLLLLTFARGVERLAQVARALTGGDEIGIERVVQLTGQ